MSGAWPLLKKGFPMTEKRSAVERYRLALSTALRRAARPAYTALTEHEPSCLPRALVELMLEECGWDAEDFKRAYLAGELGE